MPTLMISGGLINYEILEPTGRAKGPAVVLSPGSRNPMSEIKGLGVLMAAAGYRVFLHDRRNCGASDVGFDASRSEYEMWADDLHELMGKLCLSPVIMGGSSSGARLSLTLALRHPGDVCALLLTRITGGRFAVDRLVEKYYDQHARAARQVGMAAVCQTEHFAEMIRNNPRNKDLLMGMRPADFIACMEAWRAHFIAGIDLPLVGTTEAQLRSLKVPVAIIPGNDLTHPLARGALVQPLIPGAELCHVTEIERNVDVTPPEEWHAFHPAMARFITGFLARRLPNT